MEFATVQDGTEQVEREVGERQREVGERQREVGERQREVGERQREASEREMPCPICGHVMPDLKGGKATICPVCGFKDSCCY